MPSVKIPRKSTATDMTPFVDVAFLILSFFMLATKFKPPAPLQITTPHSVSSDQLKEQDAVLVEFDSSGRVFFTLQVKNPAQDDGKKLELIRKVNEARSLGLSEGEMQNFMRQATVGSPFKNLKALLATSPDKRSSVKQPGIPVDSTNNELVDWIGHAVNVFQGRRLNIMVKGDNSAKYPAFKGVVEAFRKNEQFKYQLITEPETVPFGTDLYKERNRK